VIVHSLSDLARIFQHLSSTRYWKVLIFSTHFPFFLKTVTYASWIYKDKRVERLEEFRIVADIKIVADINTDRFIQPLSEGAKERNTCQWQSRMQARFYPIYIFIFNGAGRYRLRTPWAIDVYSVNRQKRTKRETCRHEDCQAQLGFGHQAQSVRFCWSLRRETQSYYVSVSLQRKNNERRSSRRWVFYFQERYGEGWHNLMIQHDLRRNFLRFLFWR